MNNSINEIDNERILASPPKIDPLPSGTERVRWSVMIPVYNCAAFLPLTLRSVLAQAMSIDEMQIEVVDDCSTDGDIEKIVQEIGGGRIQYFRQTRNVGSLRNFLTCIERSRGELIHLLHGDDCVRNGFYKKLDSLFKGYPELGAAYARFAYIDEDGKILFNHDEEMSEPGVLKNDWLERICERQRIQYVAMVVKREVYETLGGFYGVEYGEDWEMWARISAKYPVGYCPEILADYRKHSASISGQSSLTGRNMDDLNYVIEKVQQHLPAATRHQIVSKSKKFYAHYALRTANAIWKNHRHRNGVRAQVKEAWKMHRDPLLFYKILKLYTKITLNI
jgi:glycosyltransferase involved in cell wall biosynthesis